MSLTGAAEGDLLSLIFLNTNWANVGDLTGLRGSSSAGSLYASLHTAPVGTGGNQSTNETGYSGYTREGVVRSAVGWSGPTGTNPAAMTNQTAINFPQCGVTGSTVTDAALGVGSAGATEALFFGSLSAPSSIVLSLGITPSFGAGNFTCTMT